MSPRSRGENWGTVGGGRRAPPWCQDRTFPLANCDEPRAFPMCLGHSFHAVLPMISFWGEVEEFLNFFESIITNLFDAKEKFFGIKAKPNTTMFSVDVTERSCILLIVRKVFFGLKTCLFT